MAGLPRMKLSEEEATMWITLFTIVISIAVCFGLGAMALESYEENARP
jgi:hypothetical protein